jgi:hypothetical protein
MARPGVWVFVVILIEVLVGYAAAQASSEERVAYYSDYFSFIGLIVLKAVSCHTNRVLRTRLQVHRLKH